MNTGLMTWLLMTDVAVVVAIQVALSGANPDGWDKVLSVILVNKFEFEVWEMADKFDVIVIGSGMGGLAAAGILARLKDKRVLILEKHYVAGGQTHEFHRNQYSWDVGIHYVGGMAAGEQNRLLADLITGKQVDWNPMPDVFDRFMYPDLTVDVHKDPTKFAKTLIAAFPAEEAAIWQYIRDLKAANNWYIAHFLAKIPDALAYHA